MQKISKLGFWILLSFGFAFFQLSAQVESDFEAYKKAQRQRMAEMQQRQQRGLDSLRNAQNRAFLELLEKEWEYVSIAKGERQYNQPKPPAPPSVLREDYTPPVPIIDIPLDKPKVDSVAVPQSIDDQVLRLDEFDFFSATTVAPIFAAWPEFSVTNKIEQSQISAYWKACIELEALGALLKYVGEQQKTFSLNDWATIVLVRKIADLNFSKQNSSTAFEWFVLIQLGYDVRLMFDADYLYIAYPIQQKVFAKNYFVFDGSPYYLVNSNPAHRLYTYQGQFAGAERFPTFSMLTQAELPPFRGKRSFEFSWRNNPYKIELFFNYGAMGLYQTVPQLDLDYYFTEPAHASFDQAIFSALKPYVDTIEDVADKVRFLHSMVLYSIPYQTDDEQFGFEKFCLPEEVLYHPYADCEDRTFLLNYLIKTLLGIRTIGLHFPGHMSMAVELPNPELYSAVFVHNGRKYVYCDPTYFGADIGLLPKEYRGVQAEVVE